MFHAAFLALSYTRPPVDAPSGKNGSRAYAARGCSSRAPVKTMRDVARELAVAVVRRRPACAAADRA